MLIWVYISCSNWSAFRASTQFPSRFVRRTNSIWWKFEILLIRPITSIMAQTVKRNDKKKRFSADESSIQTVTWFQPNSIVNSIVCARLVFEHKIWNFFANIWCICCKRKTIHDMRLCMSNINFNDRAIQWRRWRRRRRRRPWRFNYRADCILNNNKTKLFYLSIHTNWRLVNDVSVCTQAMIKENICHFRLIG